MRAFLDAPGDTRPVIYVSTGSLYVPTHRMVHALAHAVLSNATAGGAPAPWRVIWSVTSDEIREKLPPWVHRDPAPGDVLFSHWTPQVGRSKRGGRLMAALRSLPRLAPAPVPRMHTQEPILRHPRVAAYVAHGGINSVLEAVAAHVPLLCFGFGADQVRRAVDAQQCDTSPHYPVVAAVPQLPQRRRGGRGPIYGPDGS